MHFNLKQQLSLCDSHHQPKDVWWMLAGMPHPERREGKKSEGFCQLLTVAGMSPFPDELPFRPWQSHYQFYGCISLHLGPSVFTPSILKSEKKIIFTLATH